jgi:hypothetical protein
MMESERCPKCGAAKLRREHLRDRPAYANGTILQTWQRYYCHTRVDLSTGQVLQSVHCQLAAAQTRIADLESPAHEIELVEGLVERVLVRAARIRDDCQPTEAAIDAELAAMREKAIPAEASGGGEEAT